MNKKILQNYNFTASSFEKYLLLNGWKRDFDFKNRNLMVFHIDNKRIAIPASETFDDFYEKVLSVLETISHYQNRSVNDIVKDIRTSYYDRLEFRIISEMSEQGCLPMGYASACIEGLKDLILYSTCAELKAEPVCLRSTNSAKELLDNFKLAQTEKGSYIFNIDTQVVDESNEQLTMDEYVDNPTIEHKVVKRISNSIKQVDNIVKNSSDFDNILKEAYITGITANICDALLKLKPTTGNISVEATVRYASALSKKTGALDKLNIGSNHFYILNEISKQYREMENDNEVTLHGVIRSLTKENESDKIIQLITIIDGKYRNIKMELSPDDFKTAYEAFGNDKEVKVHGIIDKKGKSWRLYNISYFKVE